MYVSKYFSNMNLPHIYFIFFHLALVNMYVAEVRDSKLQPERREDGMDTAHETKRSNYLDKNNDALKLSTNRKFDFDKERKNYNNNQTNKVMADNFENTDMHGIKSRNVKNEKKYGGILNNGNQKRILKYIEFPQTSPIHITKPITEKKRNLRKDIKQLEKEMLPKENRVSPMKMVPSKITRKTKANKDSTEIKKSKNADRIFPVMKQLQKKIQTSPKSHHMKGRDKKSKSGIIHQISPNSKFDRISTMKEQHNIYDKRPKSTTFTLNPSMRPTKSSPHSVNKEPTDRALKHHQSKTKNAHKTPVSIFKHKKNQHKKNQSSTTFLQDPKPKSNFNTREKTNKSSSHTKYPRLKYKWGPGHRKAHHIKNGTKIQQEETKINLGLPKVRKINNNKRKYMLKTKGKKHSDGDTHKIMGSPQSTKPIQGHADNTPLNKSSVSIEEKIAPFPTNRKLCIALLKVTKYELYKYNKNLDIDTSRLEDGYVKTIEVMNLEDELGPYKPLSEHELSMVVQFLAHHNNFFEGQITRNNLEKHKSKLRKFSKTEEKRIIHMLPTRNSKRIALIRGIMTSLLANTNRKLPIRTLLEHVSIMRRSLSPREIMETLEDSTNSDMVVFNKYLADHKSYFRNIVKSVSISISTACMNIV